MTRCWRATGYAATRSAFGACTRAATDPGLLAAAAGSTTADGYSRAVLRDYGNLSSPTILFVPTRSALRAAQARDYGVLMAFGQVLRWSCFVRSGRDFSKKDMRRALPASATSLNTDVVEHRKGWAMLPDAREPSQPRASRPCPDTVFWRRIAAGACCLGLGRQSSVAGTRVLAVRRA